MSPAMGRLAGLGVARCHNCAKRNDTVERKEENQEDKRQAHLHEKRGYQGSFCFSKTEKEGKFFELKRLFRYLSEYPRTSKRFLYQEDYQDYLSHSRSTKPSPLQTGRSLEGSKRFKERKKRSQEKEEKEIFIYQSGIQNFDSWFGYKFSTKKYFDSLFCCEKYQAFHRLFELIAKSILSVFIEILILIFWLIAYLSTYLEKESRKRIEEMAQSENTSRTSSSSSGPTPAASTMNGNVGPRRQVTVNMPMPGSAEFPLFDGDEASNFLKRFETACNRCYYTQEERFLEIGMYCTRAIQMRVETFDSFNENWEKFKKEFLKEFKQRDAEQLRKSRGYLIGFANNARKEDQLKEYCRTYDMISKELFEDKKIDEITRAELFLRGLPPNAQRKVVEKCQINSDEPNHYDYKKWLNQAMKLVDSTLTLESIKQEGHANELYNKVTELYSENKLVDPPVKVLKRPQSTNYEKPSSKEQDYTVDDMIKQFSEMKINIAEIKDENKALKYEFAKSRLGLDQEQYRTNASQYQQQPQEPILYNPVAAARFQQNGYGRSRPGCYYCRDQQHLWKQCPDIKQMIEEGLVHVTQYGKLAFGEPCRNPELVPRLPEEDKINELRKAGETYRDKTDRLVQVNSVDYMCSNENDPIIATADYSDSEFDLENSTISAARYDNPIGHKREVNPLKPNSDNIKVMKERVKREQSLPSISKPDELREYTKRVAFQPKVEEIDDVDMDLGSIPIEPPGVKIPDMLKEESDITKAAPKTPLTLPPLPDSHKKVLEKKNPLPDNRQKKNSSKEETKRIEEAVKRTLMAKEIISHEYPGLKSRMNDEVQLTTRELIEFGRVLLDTPVLRVNNTLFHEVHTVCERGDLARAPVRVETAEGSLIPVKALLDGGSSVCVCSQDLARSTGQPWESGENMGKIIGVNGAPSRVIGVIKDMPIRIGDTYIFVDCLIIPNAQYQLLLGVSFMKKGKVRMEYGEDGRCDIELRDKRGKIVRFVATWGKPMSLNY